MRIALACILSTLLVACELDRSPGSGDVASLISAIFRVGTDGRALSLINGAEISIPKGALNEDSILGFQAVDEDRLPPLPDGLKAVSLFYAATPHGQEFDKPVSMGLPHQATDHLQALALRLDDPTDDTWDPLTRGVEMTELMARISTDHFSFFVIAEPIGSSDCGNAVVDKGEACDDGDNTGEYGGCMPGCKTLAARCGDKHIDTEAGEVCDPPSSCIQPDECGLVSGCSSNRYEGDPAMCTGQCISGAVVNTCAHGDGCCPDGCLAGEDDDCAACDNGELEAGETCEDGTDQACPSDCDDRVACTTDVLVNGDTCQAYCEHESITAVDDGDGCCPPGENADSDADCSAQCGNGVIDSDMGELCEPGVGAGCPTTCDDGNPCTQDLMSGSPENCNVACTHFKTTQAVDGDLCCPTGQTANTDSDCSAICGNNQIEEGETCEPGVGSGCPTTCDDGDACTTDQVTGDPAMCNLACAASPVTLPKAGDACCPPGANSVTDPDCQAQCGNGVIDPGEMCEEDVGAGCPTDCDDRNPCTADSLSGSADQCTAVCAHTPITVTEDADGCCPADGNAGNDSDCNPICGNGSIEGVEFCEPGVGDGCPTACDDDDPCTRDELVGTAGNCSAHCVHEPITTPENGDLCCPSPQANANNDDDCTPTCGNGEVEAGESCDGDCPTATSCDDDDPCTTDSVVGTACGRRCQHVAITTAANGDLCCPAGANANNDDDCSTSCGNGVVEGRETCDGNCPTSCDDDEPCTADRLAGTPGQCNVRCVSTAITTPENGDLCCPTGANANNDDDCTPRCGNGVIERGETCEAGVGDGCLSSCDDQNACTTDTLTGAARTCNTRCTRTPITEAETGDGCCPDGAIFSQDNDCPLSCGDGIIDRAAGETCEPEVGDGCPTTDAACDGDNGKGCGRVVNPGKCDASCTHVQSMSSGDGCCPTGANNTVDTDCQPSCGNGIIEMGELCEGDSCPQNPARCGNDPCMTYTIEGSGCQRQCVETPKAPDTTTKDECCPKGANALQDADCGTLCGNGVIEPGETCEPQVGDGCPTAADCEVQERCRVGVLTGSRCTAQCSTTTITEPESGDGCCPDGASPDVDSDCAGCGNNIVEEGETCDGNCITEAECLQSDDPCADNLFIPATSPCQVECIRGRRGLSGEVADKCCPRGGGNFEDIDCPSQCGNGFLEAGEDCDQRLFFIEPGQESKLPAELTCTSKEGETCADRDPCTKTVFTLVNGQGVEAGIPCETVCRNVTITERIDGDGCCPQGAANEGDSDCPVIIIF